MRFGRSLGFAKKSFDGCWQIVFLTKLPEWFVCSLGKSLNCEVRSHSDLVSAVMVIMGSSGPSLSRLLGECVSPMMEVVLTTCLPCQWAQLACSSSLAHIISAIGAIGTMVSMFAPFDMICSCMNLLV